jgi:hypothetical protein
MAKNSEDNPALGIISSISTALWKGWEKNWMAEIIFENKEVFHQLQGVLKEIRQNFTTPTPPKILRGPLPPEGSLAEP